jgi:hypothetical protein
VASALVFASVTPALATNFVSPISCGWDSSLFGKREFFAFIDIVSGQALPVCFANAGRIELGHTRAHGWRSGNNEGEFEYADASGRRHVQQFGRNQGDFNLGGRATIYWLRIY